MESTTSKKYFKSTKDTILFNWNECLSGNYQFIRKDSLEDLDEAKFDANDLMAWQLVYDCYLEKYALKDDNYLHLLELESRLKDAKIDYSVHLNAKYQNAINHYEREIEEAEKAMKKGFTITETMQYLSDAAKYEIKSKEITVDEFYSKIAYYGRTNKK